MGEVDKQSLDNAVWAARSALAGYQGVADLLVNQPPGELSGVSSEHLFGLINILNSNLAQVCEQLEKASL